MTGGTTTALAGGVIFALLIVVVAGLVLTYNRLARLRNQADAAWRQIDDQLRRRYDLIPHLVETVRGHGRQEHGTLDAVMAARGTAMAAARTPGPTGRSAAEDELTRALGRLIAIGEGYPAMRANQNFVTLRVELATAEDKLAYDRQVFNSAVQSYNKAVRTLPTNLMALVVGFKSRDLFRTSSEERDQVRARY